MVVNCEKPQLEEEKQALSTWLRLPLVAPWHEPPLAVLGATAERVQGAKVQKQNAALPVFLLASCEQSKVVLSRLEDELLSQLSAADPTTILDNLPLIEAQRHNSGREDVKMKLKKCRAWRRPSRPAVKLGCKWRRRRRQRQGVAFSAYASFHS